MSPFVEGQQHQGQLKDVEAIYARSSSSSSSSSSESSEEPLEGTQAVREVHQETQEVPGTQVPPLISVAVPTAATAASNEGGFKVSR